MKKLVIVVAMGALWAGQASARDSVGCGLGTMVFDGQQGVAPQVLAATTNGTFGNQTFGISSGTLGCDPNGSINSAKKMAMFTSENLESLAQNMSTGQGETLETFADLMGVQAGDRAEMFAALKSNFHKIYSHDAVTAEEVLGNVRDVMSDNVRLRQYVS